MSCGRYDFTGTVCGFRRWCPRGGCETESTMSKLAAVAAAAGLFAAVPAFISSAQAATESQPAIRLAAADVSVRLGDRDRDHRRHWRSDRACEKKVIIRNGHKTDIKRCD